ncbi:pappalysin-2 [Anguilla rostrata]|uniref:pappalysin-2 n=1 Tax=Anguilla rostrata TaxID=7938 RepID=UPI0030CE714A
MMCIRLLVVVLVIMNTWLLNSAQSDHVQRYKRALARKADSIQASLANEKCRSASWTRQARSVARQHPLGAASRRHTRPTDFNHERYACPGGCISDTKHSADAQILQNGAHSPWSISKARFNGESPWGDPEKSRSETPGAPEAEPPRLSEEARKAGGEGGSSGDKTAETSDSPENAHATPQRGEGWRQQPKKDRPSSRSRTLRSLVEALGEEKPEEEEEEEDAPEDAAGASRGSHEESRPADYSAESEGDYSGEQEGLGGPAREPWASGTRDVPPEWMTSMYFSGQREQLRAWPGGGAELPRAQFSAELWVKPEGGQSNPAIIAGVFDNCSHSMSEKGWSVGIRTVDPVGKRDARFFFTLRTDRSAKTTTIMGHQRYQPNTWTHLVASYSGRKMALYVDGAKVGESRAQSGDLYSAFMGTCRTLLLGGDQSERRHNFRGRVAGVVLWAKPRAQGGLYKGYVQSDEEEPVLALRGDFSGADRHWTPYKDSGRPALEAVPVPSRAPVSPFQPPPCGLTVCDNADVALSYGRRWELRTGKTVRYRVVNVCEDDGGRPTVSQRQIQLQHRALSEAFRPYNVTWELSVHAVRNSSLRRRFVLSNCQTGKIGNRRCDPECDHPLTGHDGGDCLRPAGPCYNWKRRDGVCDPECNGVRYDFDDGDCCDPEATDVARTCFDPESPDRAYISVKELKDLLQLSSADTLNVFFANNSVREELAGAATWPWAKEALSHQGGMVLNPSYFGTVGHNHTMIHEMGHILGLYHVFKGVSERESCDDPCRETTPSMETGDLCADTAPTPKSKACRDPDPINDTCGPALFHGTPYDNYMSYTDDSCTNHFTPNQVARMHCYVDLVYQNWVVGKKPTPTPLPPMVIGQSSESVTIHWLPPVSGALHQREGVVNCKDCEEDGTFHQYAYEATSPRACDSSGYWTPEEAVGPPDVYQPCEPSLQAWSPELHLYDTNVTSPCPKSEGCVLVLRFRHPVVPDSLTIWVTYISADTQAITNIEFLTDSGESLNTGPQHAFCDVPLTLRLRTHKKVTGVKICTFDEKMEIDAVLLTSRPQNPLCSGCRPLRYHLHRDPPLPQGPAQQTELTFTDSDVTVGLQYQYRVQVEADGILSELSPPLHHTHGAPYCGDGELQGKEECDDRNLLDGDGCTKKCLMEPGFNCEGQPSLCYVFDGDGVCEEFERGSSVRDCGFFTPPGFSDQWASNASASHQDRSRCPAAAVIGEPSLAQVCRSQYMDMNDGLSRYAWYPCTAQSHGYSHYDQEHSVWLKVEFSRPGVAASVIVYLSSDGSWLGEQCRREVTVQLSDTAGRNHSLGSHELSCQRNPLVVNVTHNLSLPFFLTAAVLLNFSSPLVAVTGVALRTSCHFSAFALTGCVRRPCSVDACSPPQLEHGAVTCDSGPGAPHCSVLCHQGYALSVLSGRSLPPKQKKAELECVHGAWDRVLTCHPIDCGFPDQSHIYFASFSCPDGTTFGKKCSFTCRTPAKLQGVRNWLACLEDGMWSFPEAYCKIECPEPPAVPNAKLLVPQCEGRGHDVGTVCRYKCKPGYYVTGSLSKKPKKKFLKVECLEGGQWEEGGCESVSCPSPPAMFEGMYTCTKGLEFDSLCTLHCPDLAEKQTIRCSKDGSWTEEFEMCRRLQGSCPPPPDLNLVEYTCDEGLAVGAVCYPTCIVALSDPVVLANDVTADTVKHWMLPRKVENIVCTGMMKWHPDPKLVYCIQSCEPFAGDGWCDTINNRAYCQYDGGDCCSSTLSTKKVIQFGADCHQDECTCRDPDAEENQQKAKFLAPEKF